MGVNISRAKGQLQRTEPTEDAVICLVISGAAVAGKIALSEPKQIFTSDALVDLGITAGNNALAFKEISDFYDRAGEGAELNFMLVSDATNMEDICNKGLDIAKKLVEFTEGRAVILIISRKLPAGYVIDPIMGFDADVWSAITTMQALAIDFAEQNIPFLGVLPGIGFDKDTIAAMPNRSSLANDFVAINCFCEKSDGIVSQGLLAGWLAKHQVHENVGRVASGKISDSAFFPDGTATKDLKASWNALNDKGIIFPIKIGGKSGYFLKDDPCLTAISSDYSSISWNRTINKVHRIAYQVLVEKLNDDVELNATTGKIESSVASDWESDVENAVRANMMRPVAGKKTEISGVKCTVDPNSDILNDKVEVAINIVRKGQAKTITVRIGYIQTI